MNLIKGFKKLNAYDHVLVLMSIITLLKLISVVSNDGFLEALHLLKLSIGLFVGFSVIFFLFRYFFDKSKKYKNTLISAFILLLVLEHDKPYILGGLMMFVLVHVAKFFVKVDNKAIFNPIVFGISVVTFLSFFIPAIDTPPATFEIINFTYLIYYYEVSIVFIFLALALINTKRINRLYLALSFIIPSLIFSGLFSFSSSELILFTLSICFSGVIIIIEPKTSPIEKNNQIVYGLLLSLLVCLMTYLQIPNAIFIAIFLGNLLLFFTPKIIKLYGK